MKYLPLCAYYGRCPMRLRTYPQIDLRLRGFSHMLSDIIQSETQDTEP
jgi:hypothetical protein